MKSLIFVITILFFACLYANGQGNTLISQPKNGSHVSQLGNTITVTVSGGIPTGRHLVVFIQDPTGQWWPYSNLSRIQGSGNWHVEDVEFGKPKDRDLQFNIQAIIIEEAALTNGLSIRGKTQFVSNGLPIIMPDYIVIREMYPNSLSGIVSVIRQ